MNKEELEKEAEEYATENYEQCIYDDVIGWKTDYEARKQAYLAGAELREKQILELSNIIKNLKKTYRKQRNKRIDNLQKENAKLKTDYNVLSCSVGDFAELQDRLEEEQRKNNGLEEQFTKAKELLTRFVMASVYFNGKETDLVEEATQFLNSEVKQ